MRPTNRLFPLLGLCGLLLVAQMLIGCGPKRAYTSYATPAELNLAGYERVNIADFTTASTAYPAPANAEYFRRRIESLLFETGRFQPLRGEAVDERIKLLERARQTGGAADPSTVSFEVGDAYLTGQILSITISSTVEQRQVKQGEQYITQFQRKTLGEVQGSMTLAGLVGGEVISTLTKVGSIREESSWAAAPPPEADPGQIIRQCLDDLANSFMSSIVAKRTPTAVYFFSVSHPMTKPGISYFRSFEYGRAVEAFQMVVDSFPENPKKRARAIYHLALAQEFASVAKPELLEEAIKNYNEALTFEPGRPEITRALRRAEERKRNINTFRDQGIPQ